jgi:hypothetical protein
VKIRKIIAAAFYLSNNDELIEWTKKQSSIQEKEEMMSYEEQYLKIYLL